jgi:hypothetical protein
VVSISRADKDHSPGKTSKARARMKKKKKAGAAAIGSSSTASELFKEGMLDAF